MLTPQKNNEIQFKAVLYGMSFGLLISLALGYLFDDLALGMVFGLGIGFSLAHAKQKS